MTPGDTVLYFSSVNKTQPPKEVRVTALNEDGTVNIFFEGSRTGKQNVPVAESFPVVEIRGQLYERSFVKPK